jgi:lipopolysaccharide transport system ATP-binding protein
VTIISGTAGTSGTAGISDFAIRLDGVGKRYTKFDDNPMLATSMLNVLRRGKRSQLWAVRDVSLQVEPGECVGIIGRNGAGKSTLLQMVSGITGPTEGRVRVRGRVAPLISVGVGFHPELSGRDNLHVNGAILGLTRAQVNERFDEVVSFAEMENFIDTPVKFYSSGMVVRLGFSMAIHSTPDVLIVDEVLAVGDVAFQMKCFDRMKEIRESGCTILVVSHNLQAVRGLADRAMLMHEGGTYFEGDPVEAISQMHALLKAQPDGGSTLPDQKSKYEADMLDVVEFGLVSPSGELTNSVQAGEDVRIRIKVRALQDVANPFVRFAVITDEGVPIVGDVNRASAFSDLPAGREATYDIVWPAKLATGTYQLHTMVGRVIDRLDVRRLAQPDPLPFYVAGGLVNVGLVDLGARFEER